MGVFVLLAFIVSLFVGSRTIPKIVLISKRKRLFDRMDKRKVHKDRTPRLGGVAFLPAFLIAFCFVTGLSYLAGYGGRGVHERAFVMEFMFLVAGAFNLFFIGLADDLVEVGYRRKFLMQVVSAGMLVLGGAYFRDFEGLFGLHGVPVWVGVGCTLLFVVFVVNAFNLIDGIDGLCSGAGILSLGVLGALFLVNGYAVYAVLAGGLMGVLCVFFYYNALSRKLKIFMGDSGSLVIGYVVSFLFVRFCVLNAQGHLPRPLDHAPVVLLGIIFVPVFDTLRVFVARIARRKSPFYPDQNHIHHKFLNMGYNHLQCTGFILLTGIGFTVLNFLLRRLDINLLLGIDLALGVAINHLLNRAVSKRQVRTEKGRRRGGATGPADRS